MSRYVRNGAVLVGSKSVFLLLLGGREAYTRGGVLGMLGLLALCAWLSVSGMAGGWVYGRLVPRKSMGYYLRWILSAEAAMLAALAMAGGVLLAVAPPGPGRWPQVALECTIMTAICLASAALGGLAYGRQFRGESP